MITKADLKTMLQFTNLNLGQAEKSFYQDLILFIIYKNYAHEIVFKGGTALSKCYGLDRFSEDLDFTLNQENIKLKKKIEQGLNHFNVRHEIISEKNKDSQNYKINIEGPLYVPGNRMSLCSLKVDISLREKILLPPDIVKIKSISNLIPMFEVVVMNKKEIFAEKIRALFTRNQARDLYDLYYMDDSIPGIELIDKKLSYYSLNFTKKRYKKEILLNEKIWNSEMRHLVKNYPDFKDVKKKLLEYF